jgi:AcrR family transcriptional regulator
MDALTVGEIIEHADVARGTFYNYFPDKDALERELASQTRARVEGEIARVNRESPMRPRESRLPS